MGPVSDQTCLAFLYPGHSAEDDYPLLATMVSPPVDAVVVHTSVGVDAHRIDDLLDLGSRDRLLEGARQLDPAMVDAVMWACTSGSFVFGWNGAHEQVDDIRRAIGVPASSTSLAFVEALRAIGARRVAVAATYPADVAQRFADFLAVDGVEVVSVASEDILTAVEVGTIDRERAVRFVSAADHDDAEVVLVPDTALHTAAWLTDFEDAVGKPVLTANQVTFWEALRLAGQQARADRLGRLFARPAGDVAAS
jgi:maleate cis-trans isomerase